MSYHTDLLPTWVPTEARRYLSHHAAGRSIRELARQAGCHASTVMRQVQKVEIRRQDPLVNEVLGDLGRSLTARTGPHPQEETLMTSHCSDTGPALDADTLRREGKRILKAMCHPSAVMAVAEGMDKAVVVTGTGDTATNAAVADRAVARALALKDWISCFESGRISRYRITSEGRAAFKKLLAEDENRASGFAESQASFAAATPAWVQGQGTNAPDASRPQRFTGYESPLTVLGRRRDKNGQPFLSDDLVRIGERLLEDFEMSQLGGAPLQDWQALLTGTDQTIYRAGDMVGYTPDAARARVAEALRDLGPGLGDVVLRCCCQLEGLETTEQSLGWSARSGKIVLRIALQRLKQYYQRVERAGGALIG